MATSPQTITLDFEAVAKAYKVPTTRVVEREVLRTMVKEVYMTPIKAAQQNVKLANVAHGTLTSAISQLRQKGVPIKSVSQRDSGNRRYTEYHLNRAKVAEAIEATP